MFKDVKIIISAIFTPILFGDQVVDSINQQTNAAADRPAHQS